MTKEKFDFGIISNEKKKPEEVDVSVNQNHNDKLTELIVGLNSRLRIIRKKFDNIESRLDMIEHRLSAHETAYSILQGIEANSVDIKQDLEYLAREIGKQNMEIDRLVNNYQTTNNEVTTAIITAFHKTP